ncbi:hypothetical protein RASY3_03600 [Ruminococcus albus SY3]|uniref:Uncharacterized protein n=1 Tax=Ruminococcus albus SY3 TaxID=1341156 RepID=A0A011V6A3_RUMAL|nr:hypothetical protein RASY3_03600 [Ruminococcus albus SY3]
MRALNRLSRELSFGSSLSRKACEEFEGRSPSITKARNQNAKRTIRAKQTSAPKKRRGNKSIERGQHKRPRSFYPRKNIAAPAVKQRQPQPTQSLFFDGSTRTKRGAKTHKPMPPSQTIDQPGKPPSQNYNPAICYMDFKSAALLSQELRYQVAPDGSRNQRAIAVDFGRGNNLRK